MATLIQIRRDTEANWTSNNPVLASGELALSTDQDKIKVGNGTSAWSTLSYINALPAEITAEISAAIDSVIDAAPGTLDTLNELAAAINDDASFYTTITNSISSSIDALDTDDIEEGVANLYFTDERAQDAFGAMLGGGTQTNITVTYDDASGTVSFVAENGVADSTTDDLTEGFTNLYFTDERAHDAVAAMINNGSHSNIVITYDDLNNTLSFVAENGVADSTTDDLAEGSTNLYFTDARALNAVQSSYEGYADQAETDANAYTDSLIGDGTVDGTAGNTVTDRIATAVADLVDSAPGTLDTLNELAAALGDDPNFATSIATTISDGDSSTLASAQSYADGLASNYDSAGSASTAESNANTYTDNAINALDTDAIAEGSSNLYFTSTRAQDATPGRVVASLTKPSSPSNGDGWLDTDNGILYIYMSDADSSQWVEV